MTGQAVHQQIARWAADTPEATAIVDRRQALTYRQLDAAAAVRASELASLGVGPADLVGLLMPQGVDLVVAELAALKLGAAYLPLDPANPPARLEQMVPRSGAKLVVTDRNRPAPDPAGLPVVVWSGSGDLVGPAAVADSDVLSEQPAYVIFTSGSTGEPKGVRVSHAALQGSVAWAREALGLCPRDRVAATFAPGFDGKVLEIWGTLTAGASVWVADPTLVSHPTDYLQWLIEQRITVCHWPTPLAEELLREPRLTDSSLRVAIAAGGRLRSRPPARARFRLMNGYGPTENAVVSTVGEVAAGGDRPPSIGWPAAGTLVHILDESLVPVPDGEVGELYLGGSRLADGYVAAAALTAERFVPDPWGAIPGARMYRSGDLGSRNPDGSIEFRGRVDRQLEIRGFRIEPGEIEDAMLAHPAVAEAYVRGYDEPSGARGLVAYLVAVDEPSRPTATQLRGHLAGRLPAYLRPNRFVLLPAMPRTPNGKVDAAALPVPRLRYEPDRAPPVPPRTRAEQAVARIWSEVLAIDQIGIHDDFFELGGFSLQASRVAARVREQLWPAAPADCIFRHPTVAALAAASAASEPAPVADRIEPAGEASAPLSLIQEEVWFIGKVTPGNAAYHTQTTIRVHGALDVPTLERALTRLAERHEMLRTIVIEDSDGEVWQEVQPVDRVQVESIDLSGLSDADRRRRYERVVAERVAAPFDIGTGPLFRWTAIRLGEQEHDLLLVEHHYVHDGWSFTVLMRELTECYTALRRGRAPQLPELPVQYGDFARWQRAAVQGAALAAQGAYWRRQLADPPPPLTLPSDRPRPRRQSLRGALLRFDLPAHVPDRILALSQRERVTPFAVMLAAFAAWLHRGTGQTDLCIGSAFANRRRETEHLIGMFVNSVVLRCGVRREATYRQLLAAIQQLVRAAVANQEYPFTQVVRDLRVRPTLAYNPLFQVMFSFHDAPAADLRLDTAPLTVFEHHNGSAKLDLGVIVIPHLNRQLGDYDGYQDHRFTVMWEYSRDLFDPPTAQQMARQYVDLLAAAVAEPDCLVDHLPVAGDGDRQLVSGPRS